MNQNAPPANRKILVIDDNPAIHADVRKILQGGGEPNAAIEEAKSILFDTGAGNAAKESEFEIDSAFQGEEGLGKLKEALAAQRPYALAFVDVRMPPGWDGVETITHLWKACPELQVVICTAYSDYSWQEMIRQLGKTDRLVILKKPFDNIEVLQLAHALTEKWRLARENKGRLQNLDLLVTERTTELQSANEKLRQEIADRMRLEETLRQAQKMEAVGQLAAGVAHDFNNLLTIVQGHTSLLLEDRPEGSSEHRALKTILTTAEKAGKLVRQLLAFSRKQMIQMHPVTVHETLATIKEMLPRLLGENIAVKVIPPAHPIWIKADPAMIEQMLMNCAVNSRDAMPEGGTLTISAGVVEVDDAAEAGNPEARPGKFMRLSVADTGTGIPAEILPRIFEPFFTTKPVGKGTGLGLAAVYGIAKQHGGWIAVESPAGRGATFHIFIPVCASPSVASSSAHRLRPGGPEDSVAVEAIKNN